LSTSQTKVNFECSQLTFYLRSPWFFKIFSNETTPPGIAFLRLQTNWEFQSLFCINNYEGDEKSILQLGLKILQLVLRSEKMLGKMF